ncbi:hypothetical protein ABW19_dt0203480 [Dactylella cylindrospora]|nr:hypothetical protein ABW19_dt0203480 [Dactylella cylindrospora]
MPRNRSLIKSLRKDSARLFETAGRFANVCDPIDPPVPPVRVNLPDADPNPIPQHAPANPGPSSIPGFNARSAINGFNHDAMRSTSTLHSVASGFSAASSGVGGRPVTPMSNYVQVPKPPVPAKTPIIPASDWGSQYPRAEPFGGFVPPFLDAYGNPAYPSRPANSGPQQQPVQVNRNPASQPNPPYPRSRSSSTAESRSSLYNEPINNPASAPPAPINNNNHSYWPYRPAPRNINNSPPNTPAPNPVNEARPRNQSTPIPPQSPATPPPASLPPPESPHWICDGCRNPIQPDSSRIHCLVCPDYDQCGVCHEKRKITKDHKPYHRYEMILKAWQFTQEQGDLEFTAQIHPERSPGRRFVNWTIQDGKRIHHLSCNDDHVRYLVKRLEPGNYRVSFQLDLFLVEGFTDRNTAQLEGNPLGTFRAAVGFVKSRASFIQETFPENGNLLGRLFSDGWYDDFEIHPSNGGLMIRLKCILPVEGTSDRDDVGIVFQWEDFRRFQSSDKALISFNLVSARFEDLLEYDMDEKGVAKAKKIVSYSYARPPSQGDSGEAARKADADDDDGDDADDDFSKSGLTLAEIFQAILEVQQEERERKEREAFLEALAEELARRKRAEIEAKEREAATVLLTNYMVAQQATAELALLAEYLRFVGSQ